MICMLSWKVFKFNANSNLLNGFFIFFLHFFGSDYQIKIEHLFNCIGIEEVTQFLSLHLFNLQGYFEEGKTH